MNRRSFQILAIEEDPLSAGLLKGWLLREKAYNFQLVWRSSLKQGLAVLEDGAIDLIILDLSLPDSTKDQTLNKIERLSESLPVIIFSATEDMELAREAVERGAQEFFLKGHIDSTLLCRSIILAIDRHAARQNLQKSLFRDEQTGLYHKTYFLEFAENKFAHARRKKNSHALILLAVSWNHGEIPSTGQEKAPDPAAVSDALQRCFRSSDLISRFGKTQYCVLALDSDEKGLEIVEDRLQNILKVLKIEARIGHAIYDSKSPRSLKDLLAEAEKKLYPDKPASRQRTPSG